MVLTLLSSMVLGSANNSSSITSVPSVVLESLIPGYGLLAQLIFGLTGLDIGLAVSGCLVVFGLAKAMEYGYDKSYEIFARYFMSSIQVTEGDDLFPQVIEWIADQRMTKKSRNLKAVTNWTSKWDNDEDSEPSDDEVLDEFGIFNFGKWAKNIPPRYEPSFGDDRFWHGGRLFFFSRSQREKQGNGRWGPYSSDQEQLTISCMGRSTAPIKTLLTDMKRWHVTKGNKVTAVYRSASEGEGREFSWDRVALRPSRPIGTVSLDKTQKASIVRDVNEYLHPSTAKWYATRGIPYRRGYLFHGPPGTGKTSLSFALAGIFGLDIYCISLMEVGLTESDLCQLFNRLPRRCVVLLEDIDSAGLRRAEEQDTESDPAADDGDDDKSIEDIGRASPKRKPAEVGGFKSQISLSGLLNSIDGVASHEGRVLIMTTNHPEKLDPALVRPGRVDLQVKFTLATTEQIRDIFRRMFTVDVEPEESTHADKPSTLQTPAASASTKGSKYGSKEDDEFLELLGKSPAEQVIEPEKLDRMADEFATLLPADTFSPAEIQGYLLMRKKEPSKALEDAVAWRDSMLEVKHRGKKIVVSQ